MTTPPGANRAGNAANPFVFWGFLVLGVLVAAAFLLKFPDLLTNPANLALTTLPPIAIGLALGIQFSGLARRLPGLTVNGIRARRPRCRCPTTGCCTATASSKASSRCL
jgi:hypothetical protein